jgi:hypothetical protein
MTCQWDQILFAPQIEAHHTLTNKIDPRFMISERTYYETRSIAQLRSLVCGAWTANDPTGYQLARSYLALREG